MTILEPLAIACLSLALTPAGRVIATIPVVADDLLLVPVRIASEDALFVLDTGSSLHVFDIGFRAALGAGSETNRVASGRGASQMNLYPCPELRLGGIDIRSDHPVLCTDLAELRAAAGLDVRGMLGLPLLQRFVLKIDCDAQQIQLLERASESDGEMVPLFDRGYARVPMVAVSARVAGSDLPLILDTGDVGSAGLSDGSAAVLKLSGASEIGSSIIRTFHGDVTERTLLIPSVAVGSFSRTNVIATTSGQDALGLGFLRRFVITIDLPGHKLYVRRGQSWSEQDVNDTSGLHLLKVDGRVTVHRVDAQSPAALAGIEPGDVLEQVDGKDAVARRLSQLRRYLRDTRSLHLSLRRGERPFELDVKW